MILPFSTKMNGMPTYFVEKIHSGLIMNDLWPGAFDANFAHKDFNMDAFAEKHAKLHTIREDEKDRWKPGNKIDFFINCRQKDMFRFAPVLPVVSVQKIQIIYKAERFFFAKTFPANVYIDERCLEVFEIPEFTQNDGFDTTEEFFNYFHEDFEGKIIHWTDLKY